MPMDIESFNRLDKKPSNLERVLEFLRVDGRAWSVAEIARELGMNPATVSDLARRRDGKELIRKVDGKRVWIAPNVDGIGVMKETGEKAESLQQLLDDFIGDGIAQDFVRERDKMSAYIREELSRRRNFYIDDPEEFQGLISPLRKGEYAFRNNRFANQMNTPEKIRALLDAIDAESFEEAARKAIEIKGAGMDVLTLMMQIMHPDKYHCVNNQTVREIDKLMENGLIKERQTTRYLATRDLSGLKAFIKKYRDYESILDEIQDEGKLTKPQTDFFMGWLDHDMRGKYGLGDTSLSGL